MDYRTGDPVLDERAGRLRALRREQERAAAEIASDTSELLLGVSKGRISQLRGGWVGPSTCRFGSHVSLASGRLASVPEEPVTFDQLEQLLLQLLGSSTETLEQQLLNRLKEQTFVGGKRVARQELPELRSDAVTTVHRVKVSLRGAQPRSGAGSRFPARCR
jgi:hypothetical protein